MDQVVCEQCIKEEPNLGGCTKYYPSVNKGYCALCNHHKSCHPGTRRIIGLVGSNDRREPWEKINDALAELFHRYTLVGKEDQSTMDALAVLMKAYREEQDAIKDLADKVEFCECGG